MIQIDEQKLRQLFKNRSNCYADAEDVVQAMDEGCFIETVNEALRLFAVSGQSEQLKAFQKMVNETKGYTAISDELIDKHLKSL